jgi:hypothetical protein
LAYNRKIINLVKIKEAGRVQGLFIEIIVFPFLYAGFITCGASRSFMHVARGAS